MKKPACALLFFILLLLALHGCRTPSVDGPPSQSPSASPSQSIDHSPVQSPTTDPLPSESLPTSESTPPAEESDLFLPADGILFPEFLIHFDFDRADWLDVNEYRDYAICLMDEEECRTLQSVLEPTTWTVAADIPAMGLEPAYILYDHAGNSLVVTPWEEDRCLIIAAEHNVEEGIHRYFAPTYVLDRFNDFLTGLTPLSGTVSTSEEQYYHLFLDDTGIEALITLATEDGSLSDEQVSAYAALQIPHYGFEFPNSTSAFDTVTQLHFGRTVANPEAAAPELHFNSYLVLEKESMDEEGTITALFRCYNLHEDIWLDELIDEKILNHIKEYLLTGNDEAFPAPVPVEIVFEIHFDVPTQTSYLYYHSVKVLSCDTEALTACLDVARNQRKFVTGCREGDVVSEIEPLTPQQFLDNWSEITANNVTFRFDFFSICDLDYDGTPEVVLYITTGSTEAGPLILHYQDGTVYGFHLNMRGFSNLKGDGTFEVDDGVFNHGIASLSFDRETCSYDIFTYCRSDYNESNDFFQEFYVNRIATTQDIFDTAIQSQRLKSDAEVYDYTAEHIEAVFSKLLNP